jgi:putative FmdB family regulatory protein
MARYDFQCQNCGVYHEHICSISALPDSIKCSRCGGTAEQVILTAPGVLTSNMSNVTQDVAIGKDADNRWSRIHAKKAERDKIRKESGMQGIERKDGVYKAHDRKLDFVKTPEPTER